MTLHRLLFLVLAFIPVLASGGTVTLRFISFPASADTDPIELLTENGKSIVINAPTKELSKPYQVETCMEWAVGKFERKANGKQDFTVYGSASALASPHQLIILTRKGATNADGFTLVALDDRPVQFGAGSFLLVNVSDQQISGTLGAEESSLDPGRHGIVKPEPEEGNANCHVEFSFRKGEKWRVFFNTNWPLDDNARGLIFFYNDPETSRLRLHSIRDIPQ